MTLVRAREATAGTDVRASHAGYVLADRITIEMNDGTESEAGPGPSLWIDPGHDAWVVGEETCVLIDFGASVGTYAVAR